MEIDMASHADRKLRNKLITQRYLAGEKVALIARLFSLKSLHYVREIAKKNGAPARKNGRPRHD
jgi:hypothetical protein